MVARFLLDTNVICEPTRPRPNKKTIRHLRLHAQECVVSSIALYEIWHSAHLLPDSARKQKLLDFADKVERSFDVRAYDREAARWHALERARLERLGRSPSFVDGQIAAIAATSDLTLVTSNGRDFDMFRGGLRMETWAE